MVVVSILLAALVVGAAPEQSPDQRLGDILLNVLSIILIALPLWDWRVALRLRSAAGQKPVIPALTTTYYAALAVAVAATLAGVLGLNRIEAVLAGGPGFLPTWLALSMLAAALIVVSLPNIPRERFLSKVIRTATIRYHHRDGEAPHPHRRWDDPLQEGDPDADALVGAGDHRPDLRDPRPSEGP